MNDDLFNNQVCDDCRTFNIEMEVTTEGTFIGDNRECPVCKKHGNLYTFRVGYLRGYQREITKLRTELLAANEALSQCGYPSALVLDRVGQLRKDLEL